MRNAPAKIFLALLCAAPASAAHARAQAATPQAARPAGWTTHNDPKGFAMDAPPGWTFANDARGRIVLQGPQGEQVLVWPTSVPQSLDARGAAALVQQLARQIDAQLSWTAAPATGSAVRVFAKGPQRNAATVMTWSSNATGSAVLFYCVEAPAAAYRAETDTLAAIVRSFRILQDTSAPAAAGAARPAAAINFVNWTEPHENAFSMSVPQGWQIVGGAYRLAATDIRVGVLMASPDGQIRAAVGDSNSRPTLLSLRRG
jgi:hypothetical protein